MSDETGRPAPPGSIREVLRTSLRLGLTSFGGPVAHLGYFRREFVDRRRWIDLATYADLVALCQMLPGPASSQLAILIGTRRAGIGGGIAAWMGFTLPSAFALVVLGLVSGSVDLALAGWVGGLKIAAVAIVAQAVILMARTLTPDWPRRAIAVLAAIVALAWATPFSQVAIIVGGGMFGRFRSHPRRHPRPARSRARSRDVQGWSCWRSSAVCCSSCHSSLARAVSRSRCSMPSIGAVPSFSAAVTSCSRCCTSRWWTPAG